MLKIEKYLIERKDVPMKKINDESFNKIFKLKKFKDLIAWDTVEVRVALFAAIVITVFSFFIMHINGKDEFIIFGAEIIKDISIALIGFLGFVVTGLAILTGSISSKVVKFFKDNDVYDNVESILISFYFLGLVTGGMIVFIIMVYWLSKINSIGYCGIVLFVTFIISYGVIYIIFYSIGLIGNCISIFEIISEVENRIDAEKSNYKKIYDSYRIIALEFLILTGNNDNRVNVYEKKMEELILKDPRTSTIQKNDLLKMKNNHFQK